MFGIGWTEFVVIAFVLLIFVGSRHLPSMLRKIGQVIGELKSASRELRNQVSDEVREIQSDIGDITSPKSMIKDAVNDLTYDIHSPYEDAKRAKDEMREEISNLKKNFQNIHKKGEDNNVESPAPEEDKPPKKRETSKERS